MKKIGILALIIVIASAFAVKTLWTAVDTENIVVNFKLTKEGTKGTFKGVESSFEFDENNLGKASFSAIVQVKTLSTENESRDEHLLSADFFDAEKYPTIVFKSESIEKSNKNGFIAKGKLTMKDKTFDVEVPFTLEKDKTGKSILAGKMDVSPSKYGVIQGDKRKDEIVTVTVQIPFEN